MLENTCAITPKVMLFAKQLDLSPAGGRELLCRLNYVALREIYGDGLILFELPDRRLQGVRDILNAFKGHIDGLDAARVAKALQVIQEEDIAKVFVDGSNLGGFVAALKKVKPRVEVITFFHNVEARFFWGSLRLQKSFRALAVLIVNYLAERKAVCNSDKIICLSMRDSRLLKKLYGLAATHVSPMALQDKMPADHDLTLSPPHEKFALFVGGGFYANRAGITWFVKHVVPHIQMKICIVGRGFVDLKHELEREDKVKVVGEVDGLAEWYHRAQFVVAPIFDGSGMKTKVAEALMYGKKVVGTPEAFSGYEDIAKQAGWVCQTTNEFIAAIEHAQDEIKLPFDPALRALYEIRYSLPAARRRLEMILTG